MAVKTRPVRLFEADDAALSMLAGALQQSRSEVAHQALSEFLHNHRDELAARFAATQKALAEGDLDAFVAAATGSRERKVSDVMASMPKPASG